jgi:hypothetical protein
MLTVTNPTKITKYTIDDGVRNLGKLCVPIPDVARGKCRLIKIQMHFGYTELFVTAIEQICFLQQQVAGPYSQ